MTDIFDQIAGNVPEPTAAAQGDFFDQIAGNTSNISSIGAGSSVSPSFGYGDAALSMLKEAPVNIWGGIKNAPGVALDLAKNIPYGISNLAHLPGDALQVGADAAKLGYSELTGQPFNPTGTPQGSAEVYDRINRTLHGTGLIAATVASGGTALGPILGGAAGALAYNKLNQATGADTATAPQQDIKDFEQNLGIGALLSAVVKGGQKIAGSAPELANTLDRKSLGTRQSDYGKISDTRTVESPEGVPETFLKSSLNDLLENGKLGASRDPAKLTKIIDEKTSALTSQINGAIKNFDESSTTPINPQFDNALNYITNGQVPADLIDSYVNRLDSIDKAINEKGGGKLSFLQKQKVAFGKSYDPADKVLSGFNRAIYNDLKTTIEQHAPEVKDLNAELAKYIVTEPIVNRALKASENASPLSKLGDLAYTTGGIGAPAIVGSILGGPVGTAVGAAIGLSGKALKSPAGQSLIAKVLRGAGGAEAPLGAVADPLTASFQAQNAYAPPADSNQKLPVTSLLNSVLSIPEAKASEAILRKGMDKAPTAQIFEEIKKDPVDHAIMLMESGGDPKAKNPNSSASGLFQLVSGTAKNLGVKDVFDPAQNYAGFQKLKADTIKQFGTDDINVIYASHYLGAPTLKKWIDGATLTAAQKAQVKELQTKLLPKLNKIYNGLLNNGAMEV